MGAAPAPQPASSFSTAPHRAPPPPWDGSPHPTPTQELSAPWLLDLSWLPGLDALRCLALRGCAQLPPTALGPLQALPGLAALDLSGAALLDATCASVLASLRNLQARPGWATGRGGAVHPAHPAPHRRARRLCAFECLAGVVAGAPPACLQRLAT